MHGEPWRRPESTHRFQRKALEGSQTPLGRPTLVWHRPAKASPCRNVPSLHHLRHILPPTRMKHHQHQVLNHGFCWHWGTRRCCPLLLWQIPRHTRQGEGCYELQMLLLSWAVVKSLSALSNNKNKIIAATLYLRGSDSSFVHVPQMLTCYDKWGYGQG